MELSYIFSKESFSYISGNGTFLYFRKLFIFWGVTFQDQKFFIVLLIKKQNFLN